MREIEPEEIDRRLADRFGVLGLLLGDRPLQRSRRFRPDPFGQTRIDATSGNPRETGRLIPIQDKMSAQRRFEVQVAFASLRAISLTIAACIQATPVRALAS